MKINSILLKLLGTFYRHHKRTFTVTGLDNIYSKAILERYLVTCRRRVVSTLDRIPLVPHLGYIKYEDVDIPSKSILLTDIAGAYIDMNEVSIVSFMYIDSDQFFPINNGVLSDEGFDTLSQEWEGDGSFPVVFHKNVDTRMTTISSLVSDEKSFSMPILRLMAEMTTYNRSSVNDLYTLINIILGAQYITGAGVVEEIFEDYVLIDGETFQISGKIIVSEGQVLSGITLLEELASVSINEDATIASEKISTLIDSATTEESKKFLTLLGANVSKNLIVANIPLATITSVDTETISSIASLVSTTSYMYVTETIEGEGETHDISPSSEMALLLEDPIGVAISIESGLELNIETSLDISVGEDVTATIPIGEEQELPDSEGQYTSDVFEDVATVLVSEEALNLIFEYEGMMVDDDYNTSTAELEDHDFVHADDSLVRLLKEQDDLTLGDTVLNGVFSDGIISGDDEATMDATLDTILASDNADTLMASSYASLSTKADSTLSIISELEGSSSYSSSSNIGVVTASRHQIVAYTTPSIGETNSLLMEQTEGVSMEKIDIVLNATYSYTDSIYATDTGGYDIMATDTISVEDVATVGTNTIVDE